MKKINTKNIHTNITITIFSTITILIAGAFMLFISVVYGLVDIWIGTSVYLFAAIIPLIIFTISCLKSLNIDSVSHSTGRIVIVHNKDLNSSKTKNNKHLVIGV